MDRQLTQPWSSACAPRRRIQETSSRWTDIGTSESRFTVSGNSRATNGNAFIWMEQRLAPRPRGSYNTQSGVFFFSSRTARGFLFCFFCFQVVGAHGHRFFACVTTQRSRFRFELKPNGFPCVGGGRNESTNRLGDKAQHAVFSSNTSGVSFFFFSGSGYGLIVQ